jgi:hypothetical protein
VGLDLLLEAGEHLGLVEKRARGDGALVVAVLGEQGPKAPAALRVTFKVAAHDVGDGGMDEGGRGDHLVQEGCCGLPAAQAERVVMDAAQAALVPEQVRELAGKRHLEHVARHEVENDVPQEALEVGLALTRRNGDVLEEGRERRQSLNLRPSARSAVG